MEQPQKIKKLAVLQGGDWYVQRMEQLLNDDLNDPRVQDELRHVSIILVNNYYDLKEDCELKRSRPIGFRMSQLNQLINLADKLDQAGFMKEADEIDLLIKNAKGEYGGKGEFDLPDEHKAAMPVTKGGSSCSNCKWVDAEKNECKSDYYIKWNGGDPKIPMPLDEFCSDWWQAK